MNQVTLQLNDVDEMVLSLKFNNSNPEYNFGMNKIVQQLNQLKD